MAYHFAQENQYFKEGEGLVENDIDKTIRNIGNLQNMA